MTMKHRCHVLHLYGLTKILACLLGAHNQIIELLTDLCRLIMKKERIKGETERKEEQNKERNLPKFSLMLK